MKLRLAALFVAFCVPLSPLLASDHIDGPVTINHAVADITDLFAFPSPDHPGHLALILNVYNAVAFNGHFSDKVTYSFLVRHASIRGAGEEPGFDTSGDYRVACTFETPHTPFAPHWVTCKSSSGTSVRQRVGEVNGQAATGGLRVFAGRRSDPFFFNLAWSRAASEKGKLLPPNDDNVMQNRNILSIVLVIDIEKELGLSEGSLFAVAAETTTQDDGGATRQIDRVGRPEITNVSMAPHPHDEIELRDLYNDEKSFSALGPNVAKFRKRLRDNVDFYDDLDHKDDWTPKLADQLVEILLNDYQVVDVSKPYAADTYFEIEHSILHGKPHSTCGGRAPNDDVMDTLYTLLINAGNPPRLRDGVDQPTRLATNTFPYLAEPTDGIGPELNAFKGRAIGRLTIPGRMRWLGAIQLLSGVAGLIGALLLVFYGIRLGVARVLKREYSAGKRARSLRIIGVLFGVASLFGLVTSAFTIPTLAIHMVLCILVFYRFSYWKKQTRTPGDISHAEPE